MAPNHRPIGITLLIDSIYLSIIFGIGEDIEWILLWCITSIIILCTYSDCMAEPAPLTARWKRIISLRFRKFLLVLATALIFEPAFRGVDCLGDWLRFGESAALWQKLLESYLVLYGLFRWGSRAMGLSFQHSLLYGYLLQSLVLRFLYQRFFEARVRVVWLELARNLEERQEAIVSSGGYLLAFAVATKCLQAYSHARRKEHRLSGQRKEDLEYDG